MDLEEAARQSGVIPPDRVAAFLACLDRIPDYSWLLRAPHPECNRLQGDLLGRFPVALVDRSGAPRCTQFTVLVINNTCDLQPGRSEFMTVAPVMDFAAFSRFVLQKRGGERARNYLRDVKANQVFEMLWLPAFGQFEAGAVVFLDRMSSAAMEILEAALERGDRLASFSQHGFYFLLIKLTKHLARPESDEVVRYLA